MSYQGGQARQRRAMDEAGLDGCETRQLQASNQVAVGGPRLHGLIVQVQPPATVGNGPGFSPATACNSTSAVFPLVAAIDVAAGRCGYSDKDLAGFMGISPGTWSRQKNGVDNCHVQLDKLAMLPKDWQREFAQLHGAMVGVQMAHRAIADLPVARVGELLVECNSLHAQIVALLGRTA